MELSKLEIGAIYRFDRADGALAYYCGLNKYGSTAFELLDSRLGIRADATFLPEEWKSKATNKYWCYTGLHKSVSALHLSKKDADRINMVEDCIPPKKIHQEKITRLEIINHASNGHSVGRILTLHKELGDFNSVEISVQDGGLTLKIFLD